MKKIFIIALIVVGMVGCDGGLSSEVNRKTMTADNAINNYEWFKIQTQDIQRMYKDEIVQQSDIDNLKAMLSDVPYKEWERYDKEQLNFLRTVLTGTKTTLNQMVAEYQAKASMKHKGLFENNLPTNIVRGVDAKLEFKYGVDLYKQSGN